MGVEGVEGEKLAGDGKGVWAGGCASWHAGVPNS